MTITEFSSQEEIDLESLQCDLCEEREERRWRVTIRVVIQNMEQRKVDGKHVNATLEVTLIEGVIVNGHASEQRTLTSIEPRQSQEFSVYAMRSILLSAHNKP